MEDPPKHNNSNKKNNRKTLNIGAGAGSFGIGGFVLVGGAIVTATLVSAAFAFKNRRQKQSSSSSSSSTRDEVTSMKEVESKTIHDSSQDEKHNSGTDNDEKVVTEDSNKDQDNTLDYVDSDLVSEEADNSYEKIALDSERRVDRDEKVDKESLVASDVDSVLESKDIDKSYENIALDSEWRDDGDAKVDTESLVSDESATSTAECDAVKEDKKAVEAVETMQYEKGREAAQDEVPLENNVSEASDEDIPNGHVDEDQERVLTNEEDEAAHVDLVKIVQLLEDEKEKDGHSEMIAEDMEDIMETADHEVAAVVHETHDEVSQTSESNKPPTPSMNEETEQKIEARVTKDDEQISNEEKDTEDEIRHLQVIDEHPEERQDNTLTRFIDEEETSQKDEQQVTTEDDLINKEEKDTEDEIRHLQVIDEQPVERQDNTLTPLIDGNETSQKGEQQVTTEDDLITKEEKHTEGEVQRVQVIDDQQPKREDDAPTQLINKEEKVEEPMVTKDSLVKEDDQTHVQSTKEDEEVNDVTVRSQVTSEGTEKSIQEEPTQEEKTGNQKIEENREENKTIIGKEQNGSSHNGIEKEDKDSKSASTFVMDLTKGKKQALASKRWNLKLGIWSILVSIWCLFHWYSELPFPEVSLVCSLMFILILLGYRNRTTHLVKYE